MSIRELLQVMELQKEVNRLRAEKFVMGQRLKEAEEFLNVIADETERSRQYALSFQNANSCHPAVVAYSNRQSAYECAAYIFEIFVGDRHDSRV